MRISGKGREGELGLLMRSADTGFNLGAPSMDDHNMCHFKEKEKLIQIEAITY